MGEEQQEKVGGKGEPGKCALRAPRGQPVNTAGGLGTRDDSPAAWMGWAVGRGEPWLRRAPSFVPSDSLLPPLITSL